MFFLRENYLIRKLLFQVLCAVVVWKFFYSKQYVQFGLQLIQSASSTAPVSWNFLSSLVTLDWDTDLFRVVDIKQSNSFLLRSFFVTVSISRQNFDSLCNRKHLGKHIVFIIFEDELTKYELGNCDNKTVSSARNLKK